MGLMESRIAASTIPVVYSPNPELVFKANNEFGQFAVVLADTFEEAWAETLELVLEADGPCDHGETPAKLSLMNPLELDRVEQSCDCEPSETGVPVWACHTSLDQTFLTISQFESVHGEGVERIDR
jgi:hypothetical protein